MSADQDDLQINPLALAIQEQFLEEWRAGRRPRLSVYARRYPAYASALADLVASLPPDVRADEAGETRTDSFPERLWSGAGVARALADIFGVAPEVGRRLPHVAEERSSYRASRASDDVVETEPDDHPPHD